MVDAHHGVGVSFGSFVEELTVLDARRAGISHCGAEIGDGREGGRVRWCISTRISCQKEHILVGSRGGCWMPK